MPLKNLSLHSTKFHVLGIAEGHAAGSLDWCRTEITDIAKLGNFTKLSWLDVKQMKLNPADVAALQAKLPNCKIEWDGGRLLRLLLRSRKNSASSNPTSPRGLRRSAAAIRKHSVRWWSKSCKS